MDFLAPSMCFPWDKETIDVCAVILPFASFSSPDVSDVNGLKLKRFCRSPSSTHQKTGPQSEEPEPMSSFSGPYLKLRHH